MGLKIPQELEGQREQIAEIRKQLGYKYPELNWDSLAVWYGNKIPQYLWNQWRDELKNRGFTWQKFLKLLSHRTDIILLWYKGAITWKKLIGHIIELVEGPLGQDISKK